MMGKGNTTLIATPDEDGYRYYASFARKPFVNGHKFHVYKGILNGKGARMHDKCVVKTFLRKTAEHKSDWKVEVQTNRLCHNLAQKFNERLETIGHKTKMKFTYPYYAIMDDLDRSLCFPIGKNGKTFNENECVFIEPYMGSRIQKYVTANGWPCENCPDEVTAFAHFSWTITGGDLTVCDLQGTQCSGQFRFTDPVIHSMKHRFGPDDQGEKGISNFMFYHKCNDLCREFQTDTNTQPFVSVPITQPLISVPNTLSWDPPSYEETIATPQTTTPATTKLITTV